MYSQGCGGSSPFFGTSKFLYNASKDGFPAAVIAERALCLEGISRALADATTRDLYYACAATVTISRRMDLVFPADLSRRQLGKLLGSRATTALVRWVRAAAN